MYGDRDNAKKDLITLFEIMSRQGTSLLIDAMAESVGMTVNKFKLTEKEASTLRNSLLTEFKHAMLERT